MRNKFKDYLKEKEKIKNASIPFFSKWIDNCLLELGKNFET